MHWYGDEIECSFKRRNKKWRNSISLPSSLMIQNARRSLFFSSFAGNALTPPNVTFPIIFSNLFVLFVPHPIVCIWNCFIDLFIEKALYLFIYFYSFFVHSFKSTVSLNLHFGHVNLWSGTYVCLPNEMETNTQNSV